MLSETIPGLSITIGRFRPPGIPAPAKRTSFGALQRALPMQNTAAQLAPFVHYAS